MASQIIMASSVQSGQPQTLLSNTTSWQDALAWPTVTASWSTWQYIVTFLLALVIFDQGELYTEIQNVMFKHS